MATPMHIRQIPLSSNQLLLELVEESLEHILGPGHRLLANKLPYDGHHLLALDGEETPTLLSCDNRAGGRALLHALAVLEGINDNRGWLYRLYPGIFRGEGGHTGRQGGTFRVDDLRLVILAPTAPPGGEYLYRALPRLRCFLAQALEINGEIGLYLEPHGPAGRVSREDDTPIDPFRNSPSLLSPEEAACLRG